MNIIINNYTYIKNNNSINSIKRLLLYLLTNNVENITTDNQIKLYKINYHNVDEIVDIKINFKNDIVEKIKNIIDINYKLYQMSSKNKCLIKNHIKLIKNKLNDIHNENTLTIILTSIQVSKHNSKYFFSDLQNINNLKIVNLCDYDYRYYSEEFNNDIIFLNYKNDYYTISKNIFIIKQNNIDLQKCLNDINEINKDCLDYYVKLLCYIDKIIGDNEYDDINIGLLCDILNIKINITTNINNFIINIQKNIKTYLLSKNKNIKNIDLEIINSKINDTNIKLYITFYEMLYEKNDYIIKNNTTNSNKIYINNCKIDAISEKNKEYICEMTHSTLTLSNIIDEFNDSNVYGLLINYDVNNKLSKYPDTNKVSNVTLDWISMNDYNELLEIKSNNNKININNFNNNTDDNDKYTNTNCILPIYFNKNHWKLFKSISSHYLSLINNVHVAEFKKRFYDIYFLSLLQIFIIFNFNIKYERIKYLKIFICILRTSIQVMSDNKYNCNLETHFEIFKNNFINNSEEINKNNISMLMIRCIQYVIFNGKNSISDLFENIITKLTDKFKMKHNTNVNDYYDYINEWISLRNDILKLEYFTKKIYSNGFNKFIKYVDDNYGFVNEEYCLLLLKYNDELNEKFNFKDYFSKKTCNNYIYDDIYDDIRNTSEYKQKYIQKNVVDNENELFDF